MAAVNTRKMSVADLVAEIDRRRRKLPKLNKLAARLEKKLGAVRAEIAELGGRVAAAAKAPRAGRKPRKRARNKMTLADAIAKVLQKDKAKSVPQIAADVAKAGYRSTSKTFHTIIYQTLAKHKLARKASRGRYVLKG